MAIKSIDFFNQLYRIYYPALCYYAMKIVAEQESARDIVEDVFTKLITSEKMFSDSDNIRAWLYTATRNASFDQLKLEKHAKERQFEFSQSKLSDESAYDYEIIRAELLNKILQELKGLPGHSGTIIELCFFKGMRNDQVAQELGLSEKTVRNLKSSALATLRSRIPSDLFFSLLLLAGPSVPMIS